MNYASSSSSLLIGIVACLSAVAGPKLPWAHLSRGDYVLGMQLRGDSLYISTQDGFVIVNRKSLASTRLNTATASLPKNSFETFFVDSKRRIWLSTAEKVFLWEQNNWKLIVFPLAGLNEFADIFTFSEDTHGNIWGSEYSGALIRFGNGVVQVFDSTNSPLKGPIYWLMDADPAGGIWAKSSTGVVRFKDGTWSAIPDSRFSPCLDASPIRRLRGDANGHLWILTQDRLIEVDADSCHSRFDGLRTRFGTTGDDKFGNNLIIDGKGDKWTGFPGAVVRFSDTARSYNLSKPPFSGADPYRIPQVEKDTGSDAWIFAKAGSVLRLNTSSGAVDSVAFGDPKAPNNPLTLAQDSNGKIWVGSSDGIQRLDNGTWTKTWPDTSFHGQGGTAWFIDLQIDKRGTMIGCNAQNTMVVFQADGKPVPPPWPVFFGSLLAKSTKGDVWAFGGDTDSKTFHMGYFNGLKWVSLAKEPACTYCQPTEAVFDSVGTLWLASTEGLFRFKDSLWTKFPAGTSGPISNVATSVEFDSQGRLWIATDKGITIYDGQTWKNLTKMDFGGREENIGFLKRDSKGRMWMGLGSFYYHSGWVGYFFENTLSFLEPSDGLLENTVNFFATGTDGAFYIGSQSGINTFKESKVIHLIRGVPLFLRPVSGQLHDALGRKGQGLRGKVFAQ